MKTVHTISEPTQFPEFWNEEWLQVAINELDTRSMTPEERLTYEMTLSANALAVKNEGRRIREAEERVKVETVGKALAMGLTVEQSAELAGVTTEFVEMVRRSSRVND